MYQSIEKNITDLIGNTLKTLGFDLVSVHLHGTVVKTLEVLIDRLDFNKVTIEDCALVSRNISTLLDVEDVIEGKYYLNVSSAGVERPLVKLSDYSRFTGHNVRIHLKFALNNNKKFVGTIKHVNENKIYLQSGSDEIVIEYETIKKAHLSLTDEMFKKLLNKK